MKILREKVAEENLPISSLIMTGKFFWLYLLVVSHMFSGINFQVHMDNHLHLHT